MTLEVWREQAGSMLGVLARRLGDLDRARREVTGQERYTRLAAEPAPQPSEDDRLALIFACCYPALPQPAQVALTLHAASGLTTEAIAAAFLVPTPTLARRLVRAKRRLREAEVRFDPPEPTEYAERTDWLAVRDLYDLLFELAPSPVVLLNRAVATRYVLGAEAALAEVEALASELGEYRLLHATRAELWRALGRDEPARDALRRALAMSRYGPSVTTGRPSAPGRRVFAFVTEASHSTPSRMATAAFDTHRVLF